MRLRARANEILRLDVGDLDVASKQGRVRSTGGATECVFWQTGVRSGCCHASSPGGPVFLADRPATRAVPALDIDPGTDRARLSYRRAAAICRAHRLIAPPAPLQPRLGFIGSSLDASTDPTYTEVISRRTRSHLGPPARGERRGQHELCAQTAERMARPNGSRSDPPSTTCAVEALSHSPREGACDMRLTTVPQGTMWRRKRLRLVFAVTALVASSFWLTSEAAPVSAEIPQCGNQGSQFDGFYYNAAAHSDSFEGASAYLVNQFGAVCDTNPSTPNPNQAYIGTNFTTGWVMIAAYNGAGWSQAGFLRGYNSSQYVWAQINSGQGTLYNQFTPDPSLPNGVMHAYRELFNPSTGLVESSIDGAVFATTSFNPFGTWARSPSGSFSPQFFGETKYLESDIPGVPSAQTAFSALGVQQSVGDSLVQIPCELDYYNTNPSRWSMSPSACDAFNIWTEHTS